jgi:hypothetical protein
MVFLTYIFKARLVLSIKFEINFESLKSDVRNKKVHALQLTATAVRGAPPYSFHCTPRAAGRRDAATRPLRRLTPANPHALPASSRL